MKASFDRLLFHPSSLILKNLERETGFEPATSTLARSHSTTELLPHFQRGSILMIQVAMSRQCVSSPTVRPLANARGSDTLLSNSTQDARAPALRLRQGR